MESRLADPGPPRKPVDPELTNKWSQDSRVEPPNLPIAADGWPDRMEKDPDEATVISPGSGRDFSGEKEHLVLAGPGHQGNGISSGMLMAMRRLDAAEAGDSFSWMRAGSRSRC